MRSRSFLPIQGPEPRRYRYRHPRPGVALDPHEVETEREAGEASDLDAPTVSEILRYAVEHHLHRELDIALDEPELLPRNVIGQREPPHRPIVARAPWAASLGTDGHAAAGELTSRQFERFRSEASAGGFDALSVARASSRGTGIEHGQAQAIAKAVQSAGGAGHEDLDKRADLDSAVTVLRADMYRALWIQGVGIVAVVAAIWLLPL